MEKETLRKLMKERRKALTDREIAEKSAAVQKKLFSLPEFANAKTVMTYISAFREVSTDGIINRLFECKKRVAVPVSNTDSITLTPSYISGTAELVRGAYGIKEPSVIRECTVSDIDIIIVPGIAFDVRKNRMGFGKGYYDRLLYGSDAIKIGLCYDFQLLDIIPSDKHDIPMDIIITEERIV